MVTVFEFLGSEQIENVITCMNFNVDRVVYFGYQDEIIIQRETLNKYLRKYCDVDDISYVALSKKIYRLSLT